MAVGSQACRPNWADLAITPISRHKLINVKISVLIYGAKENKLEKSKFPNTKIIAKRAIDIPQSPTLLVTIACIADLVAAILVNQKLISK